MPARSEHAHHHHDTRGMGDRRLLGAVALNVLLTAGQVAGGVVSGSLSLVADALHNLNDAASLGLALMARRIARRPADERRTFGYRRAEVIGALINLTALILIGLYLIAEAVRRFFDPRPVEGWIVVIVGGVALLVDIATAALTYVMSRGSMNIKAAFVHNLADALGSLAVVVAGTLVLLYNLTIADVIATLAIAAYILYQGFGMMGQSVRVLMASVPPGLDLDELVREIEGAGGVRSTHHLHAWQLDEHHTALEAHIVIARADAGEMETIKRDVKNRLRERFEIGHSTLEFEFEPSDADAADHDRSLVPCCSERPC